MAAKKDTTPKTPGPASDKKQALETALAQIEKQFGKGAVMKLGANIAMQVDAIPTGSLGLDLALGIGGVPRGRIVEVYGPESSGKTTLALQILAEAQKMGGEVAFIDVEHALDPTYAAALACAEQGLKTVAVEKQNRGNYNSATIGGTNSELHKFWGMEYDTTEWMSDAMIGCSFQADMTLYQHYLEKNGEAVNWYISHFDNQDFNDYPLTFAAGDFPDFREQYDSTALSRSWNTSLNLPYPPGELADILAGILTEAGVEIRYETPACQLVTDDAGSVTGVIVKSVDGYEQYNCAKGVVLATGGYEFNQQMLKERCRPRGVPGRWLTGAFGNTGDGLQMGVAVGAAEDEFPQSIMLDPEQLMPFVRVNKLGKRFTPEYDPYGQLAMAIQYQPGTYDFYIVDSALDTKIDKIWTPSSSCYGPKEQWIAAAQSENAFKADTLEELAELMEVPADTFVETINHWNEMCAAGADTDFDMPGSMMMTIDQPPFYATKEYADGLCTTGGLIVDTECRVLDKERQPIEGLFAAGIVSGGMFYNTYPHNLNCLSHTRNCLMGYTIGQVLGGKQA